jgi:hypothetical protein
MADATIPETHPVQVHYRRGKSDPPRSQAPAVVTMRAYEVYCHLYGEQEALVTGGCRGGFGAGELVAFLYARSFPKEEWRARVKEAFRGLDLDARS